MTNNPNKQHGTEIKIVSPLNVRKSFVNVLECPSVSSNHVPSDSTVLRFFSFHFFIFFDQLSLHYRNSLHRRLLDGSPRMSTLNTTSPNESQVVDGPISLGASTNGDIVLPIGTSSLVLRRPSANMFVSLFSRFPLLCHSN